MSRRGRARRGWRGQDNGFEEWGGYMASKVQKLEKQLNSDNAAAGADDQPAIFQGIAIHVNGFTDPPAIELRRLVLQRGGHFHTYYSRWSTTHIIATNLPDNKVRGLQPDQKVVQPQWITDSIAAGRLLPHVPYLLHSGRSRFQRCLNFTAIRPAESGHHDGGDSGDSGGGVHPRDNSASTSTDDIPRRVPSPELEEPCPDPETGSQPCGTNQVQRRHEGSSAQREETGAAEREPGTGDTEGPGDLAETSLAEFATALWTDDDDGTNEMGSGDSSASVGPGAWDDVTDPSYRPRPSTSAVTSSASTSAERAPRRVRSPDASAGVGTGERGGLAETSDSPAPSTSGGDASGGVAKAPSSLRSMRATNDSGFIAEYYSHSRLHHIATWRSELAAMVAEMHRTSDGSSFPGRERLRAQTTEKGATRAAATAAPGGSSPVIMHVDMDCFFVSVGIRDRPDLKGKPVAVTHTQGRGPQRPRPGADPHYEMQYYERKLRAAGGAKAGGEDRGKTDGRGEGGGGGGSRVASDTAAMSMAEIASCSYEARRAGVKNGMFFGRAKLLCPDLQTVPYDFDGYREVAQALYETLASFTNEVEALSCDEAMLDVTAVLADTGAGPEELASAIRAEVFARTRCCASVGMGSNMLLARLATRKAKPDGQFHLRLEVVEEFMRSQPVSCLPGVGRSLEQRLASLGARTCGELQALPLSALQRELGPRTGLSLHRACRGQDGRVLQPQRERKSVSAEINYGIRFQQPEDAEAFLQQLSEELQRRLRAAAVRGRRLTLKVMVRKAGAPVETAKFGGHGVCDNASRSIALEQATDSAAVVAREAISLYRQLRVNAADMRGVGLQMHNLVPTGGSGGGGRESGGALGGGRSVGGAADGRPGRSVLELLHARVAKRDDETRDARDAVSPGAVSSTPAAGRDAPGPCGSRPAGASQTPPRSVLLDISIEIPSPSQIDPSVLAELPRELRAQIERGVEVKGRQRQEGPREAGGEQPPRASTSASGPRATVAEKATAASCSSRESATEALPERSSGGAAGTSEQSRRGRGHTDSANITALPAFSQVDPTVFAALPEELQQELRDAFAQQGRHTAGNSGPGATAGPSEKRAVQPRRGRGGGRGRRGRPGKQPDGSVARRGGRGSPGKRGRGSPGKWPVSAHLDTGLKTGSLEPEAAARTAEEKALEVTGEQPGAQGDHVEPRGDASLAGPLVGPPRASLAGSTELHEVKALLRDWVHSSEAPPEQEDAVQVTNYLQQLLLHQRDLESLYLVVRYIKRLTEGARDAAWHTTFEFILDSVQALLKRTYGSTLKL
ncbi:DNA repair protein REV1 isoform X1 [Lampetra fluviatilis]